MCACAEQKLSRRGERERCVCARAEQKLCGFRERERERDVCERAGKSKTSCSRGSTRRFSETKYGLGAKKVLKQSSMLLSW